MTNTPKYWNHAKKFLSKKDKILSKLIAKYKGPFEIILTTRKDIFFSLCKSIIGQQISVAAANAVFFKFKKKCKNKISAKTVSKLSFSQLKSCGLSRQKILVRGGKKIVTEGREFMRTAVIEFSSFDKAKEFYYSREYQAAHGLLKDTVIRSHQIIEGT